MDVIQNGRNFDYDMKKLLGLEQPPPKGSELILTVSGLTGAHKWAGLVNGTNLVDVTELYATDTIHRVTFDPGIPRSKTSCGKFRAVGARPTAGTGRRSYNIYFFYQSNASSTTQATIFSNNNTTLTAGVPVTALGYAAGVSHTKSFTLIGGDQVTVTVSKGTLWSKGNM